MKQNLATAPTLSEGKLSTDTNCLQNDSTNSNKQAGNGQSWHPAQG